MAVLSPSQCPPCRPALGNVDRDITTLRFPMSFLSALKEARKKNHTTAVNKQSSVVIFTRERYLLIVTIYELNSFA